jgi:hypothetical protein
MIVNSGLNLMRSFLNGEAPDPPSHMAIGTGTISANGADTTLGTEVLRKAITKNLAATNGVIEYSINVLSTEANGNALSEVGVLNAALSGDLLLRKVHLPYSKTSAFGVKYTIRHTIQ